MNQEKNNKEKQDIDLSTYLDGSGTQSKKIQPPKSGYLAGTPKVVQWLMRYSGGLIQSKKQASYIILILALAVIIISLLFAFDTLFGEESIPDRYRFDPTVPTYDIE